MGNEMFRKVIARNSKLAKFRQSIQDGTVWDNAPEWANYVVETDFVIGLLSGISNGETHRLKMFNFGLGSWLEEGTTGPRHYWNRDKVIATRPEEEEMNGLKVLMTMLKAQTEAEMWEEAPHWANYVVTTLTGRVGFISGLGIADMEWMFDMEDGWGHAYHNNEAVWYPGNVLSQRPETEETCQCLTEEILATMDVLNDVGHSQVIAEEFKFHLSLLLEMQRNRLMEK